MTKPSYAMILALSATLLSANSLFAQQAPADNSQKPAASSTAKPSTAAKSGSQASGAAKPGTAAKKPATAPAPLTTTKQKASYAIGMNIGNGLKKDGVDIDAAILARGLKDAMAGTK